MFELNSLQPLKGSALPTPLYWQNETISKSIYSWTTEYVYHGLSNINTENQLEIEKRALDILVKDWGVFFNHGYYVRNGVDDNIIRTAMELLLSIHISTRFWNIWII